MVLQAVFKISTQVAQFIRSEIDDHFNLHNPDEENQASWVSRTAAGLLMIGA